MKKIIFGLFLLLSFGSFANNISGSNTNYYLSSKVNSQGLHYLDDRISEYFDNEGNKHTDHYGTKVFKTSHGDSLSFGLMWGYQTLGTGSGAFTKTSMGTSNFGDTIGIVGGTYNGYSSLTNLNGITVIKFKMCNRIIAPPELVTWLDYYCHKECA